MLALLNTAGLGAGVDVKNVTHWLKNARSRDNIPVSDTRISDIQEAIDRCQAITKEWTGAPEHRPMLLPIPGRDYILTGELAAQSGGGMTTNKGTPVSFCLPISTMELLSNSVRNAGTEVL